MIRMSLDKAKDQFTYNGSAFNNDIKVVSLLPLLDNHLFVLKRSGFERIGDGQPFPLVQIFYKKKVTVSIDFDFYRANKFSPRMETLDRNSWYILRFRMVDPIRIHL